MDSGAASASTESVLAAAEEAAAEAEAGSAVCAPRSRIQIRRGVPRRAPRGGPRAAADGCERSRRARVALGGGRRAIQGAGGSVCGEGERAGDLVESLEAQIDALQRQLEEEKNGVGVKLMDEATRAAQLADQLQLTQRTANKLAVEVEGYRKDADDFNAKQALAHLQLKAAQEKIETLTEQRDEAESKADERVKAKANEVTTMRRAKERAEARAAELEAKLSETEARLELEVADRSRRPSARRWRCSTPTTIPTPRPRSGTPTRRTSATPSPTPPLPTTTSSWTCSFRPGPLRREVRLGTGTISASSSPEVEDTYAEASGAFARGALADLDIPGEWLQAYDTERELHYWYNNATMETAWELPAGARVRGGAADSGEDDDLPRHFEGPSGLNSR